jgi:hypothetical protein
VYEEIRARLISCGPIAATWLRPHRLSGDPALRRRAQELVNHFDRQTADDRFLFFCLKQGSDLDIEEGAWLLAGTKHPAINIEGYRALLDGFAAELRDRVPPGIKPQQLLSKINQYLFPNLALLATSRIILTPTTVT